jgi:hypothetical protein
MAPGTQQRPGAPQSPANATAWHGSPVAGDDSIWYRIGAEGGPRYPDGQAVPQGSNGYPNGPAYGGIAAPPQQNGGGSLPPGQSGSNGTLPNGSMPGMAMPNGSMPGNGGPNGTLANGSPNGAMPYGGNQNGHFAGIADAGGSTLPNGPAMYGAPYNGASGATTQVSAPHPVQQAFLGVPQPVQAPAVQPQPAPQQPAPQAMQSQQALQPQALMQQPVQQQQAQPSPAEASAAQLAPVVSAAQLAEAARAILASVNASAPAAPQPDTAPQPAAAPPQPAAAPQAATAPQTVAPDLGAGSALSAQPAPDSPPAAAPAAPSQTPTVSSLIESVLSSASGTHRGRRAARKPRLAMSAVFADLVDMARIPRTAYAVDDEVTGAMCLFKAEGGYEVFSCAEDARHEVRFFEDEEAAYFYLFGVLAAEAVRNGRLKPGR